MTIAESVTTIGIGAFQNCGGLTSVTIPESVTTIGAAAFAGCSGLASVTIPENVTAIGGYTFYNCDSLTSVTIPDSVNSIGEYAFYDCSGLTSILFVGDMPTIGINAFEDVTATVYYPSDDSSYNAETMQNYGGTLTWVPAVFCSVTYDPNGGSGAPEKQTMAASVPMALSSACPVRAGWYFLGWGLSAEAVEAAYLPGDDFSCDADTTLYAVWGQPDFVLPDAVTSVGAEAFENCAFRFAALSESTVEIQSAAFSECANLEYLLIPAQNVAIAADAFAKSPLLTIFAPAGGTVERFAAEYGIRFAALEK